MQTDLWRSVRFICDQFVSWQASSGGINPETCSFHRNTHWGKPVSYGQDIPWLVRALYAAYDLLNEPRYKAAADRYAIYFIACMYDKAATYALGGAIEPCFKLYWEHNPSDDCLHNLFWGNGKMKSIYRWLLGYRTDNGNYLNCGYGWWDEKGVTHKDEDVGFCSDLCEPLRGLVAYSQLFHDEEALQHAIGLACYFVTEFKPGTMDGIWSSQIGSWLIGPRHCTGFENLVGVYADEAGWAWLSYFASFSLLRLYDILKEGHSELKATIRDRCLTSLRWLFDNCQFEDGSVGMSGRDDKWLGATAMAVLQYLELYRRILIDRETHHRYYPQALKALAWLREMSRPERFPPDGYIPVTGKSKPWPGWNTVWLLAHTAEGLMAGPALESLGTP
ncbi:MAG: hypothetical protein IT330_00375 [Anaerolineae bacterium]|nr:hypothetical protein [Anaerolineae bacterium]